MLISEKLEIKRENDTLYGAKNKCRVNCIKYLREIKILCYSKRREEASNITIFAE